jgi:hypothetical protein
MVVSVWLTHGDHMRAIQLNRTDLKSLATYGTSYLYLCQNKNKPHVRPNWSWFGLVTTQYQIQPSSLGGTSSDFRSGKQLNLALLFRHSGFGLLENDKRMYEGQR